MKKTAEFYLRCLTKILPIVAEVARQNPELTIEVKKELEDLTNDVVITDLFQNYIEESEIFLPEIASIANPEEQIEIEL